MFGGYVTGICCYACIYIYIVSIHFFLSSVVVVFNLVSINQTEGSTISESPGIMFFVCLFVFVF